MRAEIRFRGQGGQGAITLGYIFGRAASLYMNRHSLLTEAYGPEKKGGFARADVLMQDDEIEYPLLDTPQFLVVMSDEAWRAEKDKVVDDGVIIYDDFMVKIDPSEIKPNQKLYPVPALKEALALGKKVVANVILMGAMQEITGLVTKEALEKALLDRVPKGTEELNLKALNRGYEIGKKLKEETK